MLAVAMIAVLLAIAVGGFRIGSAVIARHRAQAAADLSALAAAASVPEGAALACNRASVIAEAMSAGVVECRVDDLDVVVTVRSGPARAAARAGPVDDPS
ncbi:MAG: Rv3654c family TadE-like protein [Mycobacterium sp.]